MIHIFIGTKAQLIKMAPVMQRLDEKGVTYNFIDSGQHGGITNDLIRQFKLRQPDVYLRDKSENIRTIPQALMWSTRNLSQPLLNPRQSFKKIFNNQNGICLIHGDTLSTLISLFYAKRCGIKVAHVESGLRSYNLLDPFPEELVRLIAMRYSDLLFAPSEWSYENLCKMGYLNKTIKTGINTGFEAVHYALKQVRGKNRPNQPYVIVTIHRMETIYQQTRLKKIIKLIEKISSNYKILFVLHQPTRQQLIRFDLYSSLSKIPSVEMLPLLPYIEFVDLIAGANFIITDGGSIQEECYYLNKPCMVMRSKTERIEGLGENARLIDFKPKQIEDFLDSFYSLQRKNLNEGVRPSDVIIENLSEWL